MPDICHAVEDLEKNTAPHFVFSPRDVIIYAHFIHHVEELVHKVCNLEELVHEVCNIVPDICHALE